MAKINSKHPKMIALTLWLMLGLNVVFIWSEYFPDFASDFIKWLDSGLESIRIQLTILELIAVGTLFVDLVIRFDKIKSNFRTLHVIGVGICICGFIFKSFIYFLHSAYLS